jgi:hypothetical protein
MHPRSRLLTLPVAVTAMLVGTLAVAAPAQAADATVTDMASLQSAASTCTDGSTITLGADVLDRGDGSRADEVTTGCSLTLDLDDHALTLRRLLVGPGTTLTIRGGAGGTGSIDALAPDYGRSAIDTTDAALVIDSGEVSARAGSFAAGIGNRDGDFGSITINGGTVLATSGELSAGIGGGIGSTGGTVTITSGTVTAVGSAGGSGIGAGWDGAYDGVTITGGTVRATGEGGPGSGIGGVFLSADAGSGPIDILGGTVQASSDAAGIGGQGQAVTIGAGADVTATGGLAFSDTGEARVSSVGSGRPDGAPSYPFGSLTVAGTLRIPTGANLTIPEGASADVTSTGVVTGSTGADDGGHLVGPGTIVNGGSIRIADALDHPQPARITDHHYAVAFDTRGGSAAPAPQTVLAASFAAGSRPFPSDPTRPDAPFTGWNSRPDGSGVPITATSTLPGSATGGPLAVTAYAQYGTPAASIGGNPREGRTLTASTGLPAGTAATYRWKADGRTIAGATGRTLRLGKKQAARRITVTVSALGTTSTSRPTKVVSSQRARLVVTPTRIGKRDFFRVTAVGLRKDQRVRVWLGGRRVHLGTADGRGVVDRKVRFSRATDAGRRLVRVSGYSTSDTRTYTITRTVRYLSR